jgi:phytol kinase
MLHNDLLAFALYLGWLLATGVPAVLLKARFNMPFELTRKIYHLAAVLSIFPLVTFFSTWYAAVLAAALLAALIYPALLLMERHPVYRRVAVERAGGEFKSSLIVLQVSLALLLAIFWGLLGEGWKYVAVVAVMAWGLGDAAAALVGKRYGRRRIRHALIEGTKTVEGTRAMFLTAAAAIFLTMLFYGGQPWPLSAAVALLGAPVCALVELFSRRGLDTLTVPVSAGLAVLTLITLFSSLGV